MWWLHYVNISKLFNWENIIYLWCRRKENGNVCSQDYTIHQGLSLLWEFESLILTYTFVHSFLLVNVLHSFEIKFLLNPLVFLEDLWPSVFGQNAWNCNEKKNSQINKHLFQWLFNKFMWKVGKEKKPNHL